MKKIIILTLVMLSMAQAWAKEPVTRFRDKLFDNKSKYVTAATGATRPKTPFRHSRAALRWAWT